jgi:hypothetical protein
MRNSKTLLMPAMIALFGLAACGGEEAELGEEPAVEMEAPAIEAPLGEEGIGADAGEGGLVDDEVMEPGLDANGNGILDSEEEEGVGR